MIKLCQPQQYVEFLLCLIQWRLSQKGHFNDQPERCLLQAASSVMNLVFYPYFWEWVTATLFSQRQVRSWLFLGWVYSAHWELQADDQQLFGQLPGEMSHFLLSQQSCGLGREKERGSEREREKKTNSCAWQEAHSSVWPEGLFSLGLLESQRWCKVSFVSPMFWG